MSAARFWPKQKLRVELRIFSISILTAMILIAMGFLVLSEYGSLVLEVELGAYGSGVCVPESPQGG